MIVNSRAMVLGVVGRPGAPHRPTDLSLDHYVWLCEALVRDMGEKNGEQLDDLYAQAKPPKKHANRAAAIDDFLAFALG